MVVYVPNGTTRKRSISDSRTDEEAVVTVVEEGASNSVCVYTRDEITYLGDGDFSRGVIRLGGEFLDRGEMSPGWRPFHRELMENVVHNINNPNLDKK